MAVEIFLHRKITVCSLYSPRSSNLNEELLTNLLRQLSSPVIIMGDFNVFRQVWGYATVNARGRQVLIFTQNNSLNIANEPTQTTQHSETVIDLTIVSPCISVFCIIFAATKDPKASYIIIIIIIEIALDGEIYHRELTL